MDSQDIADIIADKYKQREISRITPHIITPVNETHGHINMNMDMDKKKKKRYVYGNNNKTKKKHKQLDTSDMKLTLCNHRKGNFNNINVSDRTIFWGLGVEHEMQLFHRPHSGMRKANILFDSQESTCFLTGDMDPTGSCCKAKPKCDNFRNETAGMDFGLTPEEKRFARNTQWELTGRQAKACEKDKEYTVIIKRTPILMPELITTNFSNRTIDSITNEMKSLESKYIDIQMKNPHTQQKVAKYGKLMTHLCGSHSEIMIPQRPTIYSPEYKLDPTPMTDYVGSYHVTITLPHTKDISDKDFIKIHQNMANQIQWLEPLFLTAFFSPTQAVVGDKSEPEGSYRVMTIGWGNFAGSNVRRMGTRGLDRGSNIFPIWRRTLKFRGTERLNYCAKIAPPQYRKAKTIHTGDFRTFGVEPDIDRCKMMYNPADCPKIDGAPMRPPYGLEIRIFDHFPSEYLIHLLRIIVLIACNAQRHPAKQYVYRNKLWIGALRAIMRDGWNTILEKPYITVLRKNLGLPIKTDSLMAFDVFKEIVHELFEVNKDSYFNRIMNEKPDEEPIVPEINRMCWEMGFTNKYNILMYDFLKRNFYPGQTATLHDFTKMLATDSIVDFETWKDDVNDLLYALETYERVKLETFNGKIQHITIL